MPFLNAGELSLHYQTLECQAIATDPTQPLAPTALTPQTVVLIHGLGANLAFWYLGIAKALARIYHVAMYDLRGHGRSALVRQGYTLTDMGTDLTRLLDHLQLERVHLVGHSFGARVALAYAIANPNRVHTLTVADTQISALQPQVRLRDWPYWERWKLELQQQGFQDLPDEDEPINFRMLAYFSRLAADPSAGAARRGPSLRRRDMGNKGADRWERLMETAARQEFERDHEITISGLRGLTTPTLLMFGEFTHCIRSYERLRELLPDATTMLVPEAGHFHPAVRPRLFVASLRRFLAAHGTPAPELSEHRPPRLSRRS